MSICKIEFFSSKTLEVVRRISITDISLAIMNRGIGANEYERDLALAIEVSMSEFESGGFDGVLDDSPATTPKVDHETLRAQALAAEADRQYMEQFGRTCILDLGIYIGVLVGGINKVFTNKCAVLCVWWALMIQRELGYCKGPAPYKVSDYPTAHDLYVDTLKGIEKVNVWKKRRCANRKTPGHANNGCQSCCTTYGNEESFPGDMMGVLANLAGMSIYVWDVENQRTVQYHPIGPDGTEYIGKKDPELTDHNRRIIIARTPGHYVLLPAMFRLRFDPANPQVYHYNHVTEAIARIMEQVNGGMCNRDGHVVRVGAPHPLHNLRSGGKSYIQSTDGSFEPRFEVVDSDAVNRETARRIHHELNCEGRSCTCKQWFGK